MRPTTTGAGSRNRRAFTDRLFGLRRRAATGTHEFDLLCTDLGIEHRLTPPMHPQTNGMVERFNVRIEDVLQSHRFRSGEDLEQTILRYVHLYNSQLPQSVLAGRSPVDASASTASSTPHARSATGTGSTTTDVRTERSG